VTDAVGAERQWRRTFYGAPRDPPVLGVTDAVGAERQWRQKAAKIWIVLFAW